MEAGGGGTGLARRTRATASASRLALPDERARRADCTLPRRSIEKATVAVPRLPPGALVSRLARDQEAMALMQRASPVSAPPADARSRLTTAPPSRA